MKLTKPTSQGETAGRIVTTVVAAAAVVFVLDAADAQSRRVQVGTLTRSLSVGIGLIVGSQRNVSCLLRGVPGQPDDAYTETMTRVSLDVGVTAGSVIIYRAPQLTAITATDLLEI
jgi:hypothetical protein